MRIKTILSIIFILNVLILNCYCSALTLSKRVGTTGNTWKIISTSIDGWNIVYNFTMSGTSLNQFKIKRADEETIFNDLYLNITTTNPKQYTYINKYYSTNEIADLKTDSNGKPSFCPVWYANCGVNESYFSISLNNTIVTSGIKNSVSVPMTILITIRDVITLCKQK
ncbi:hypothetical protein RB653_006074 [Dictyostelium firmibasis]|uniref:Uncharacterized protein n=1 Tax=Dictyostelium firmibasis TaxID=79012 RepID=A0AAN7UM36_9MYCE